ncbi:MAG: cytochrome c oxidase assembly protein [Aromatoleum sp.]|uniref:cytochrome c oxidase assembly protein n=1 Tax=Aromatoleum sp. TaxID=2307007 RepID=UPI002895CB6D|nr:cytochrome c oxidase assembly protein [Aromatoleum sp.]MDT3671118.1 cytochrome c oxidase assembly protein [Aromatoleum sp.]
MPRRLLAAALLAVAGAASAHEAGALADASFAALAPALFGALVLAFGWASYLRGLRRVSAPRAAQAAFHAAMLLTLAAVFGPLDRWAETNSGLHMVQHMLLIVVVAPLGALAGALPQFRAALSDRWRWGWNALAACGQRPLAMAVVHGVAIWLWHAPGPYRFALDNGWWHWLEHASFVASGWLFWWAVLHAGRERLPQALLALLLTLMHTGLLGALLSFARVPLYGEAGLQNQQLAGLVMWVPGGGFYLAAGVWVVWRLLAASPRPRAASAPSPGR